MPSPARAQTNASARPGTTVAISVPSLIEVYGSIPTSPQTARTSGRTGIASSWIRIPTPEADATSVRPPNTPPSVASCIEVTPASRSPNVRATVASGTTVICSNSASAACTTS